MEKTALILEGGGFRGMFTSGALDFFLEKELRFPYVIGVSMGACNGASYVSNQIGRSKTVNADFVDDKRYMSLRRLLTRGELFGMDFVFRTIPTEIVPYDFEAYNRGGQTFTVVVTDIETGVPVYLKNSRGRDLMDALQASASLPFISKPVRIGDKLCLDGGISDSIPIDRAVEDGYDKFVVVLTQPRGYEKPPSSANKITKYWYRRYPHLERLLRERHNNYNQARKKIFELEKAGKAFIIEPQTTIPARRIERDKEVLYKSYNMGYDEALHREMDLMTFLNSQK
jgi:predicted patatin/cPLA2 family phospholipase